MMPQAEWYHLPCFSVSPSGGRKAAKVKSKKLPMIGNGETMRGSLRGPAASDSDAPLGRTSLHAAQ
jgi:hypothetical protein